MNRPAITAVRRVVASLARPAPEFDNTAQRLLDQRLPLENVSPFDLLPNSTEPEHAEPTVDSRQTRNLSRAAAGARPTPPSTTERPAMSDAEQPAFSFRRPNVGTRMAGRGTAPMAGGVPAVEQSELEPSNAKVPTRPMDAGSRAPELERRDADASRAVTLKQGVRATALAPSIERSETERTGEASLARRDFGGAAPDTSGSRALEGVSLGTRKANSGNRNHPAMALVNAMADEILAASHIPASAPGSITTERRTPPQESLSSDGKTLRTVPEVQMPLRSSEPRESGMGAGQKPAPIDSEQLVDLVNEALVEQARRHGVDLS